MGGGQCGGRRDVPHLAEEVLVEVRHEGQLHGGADKVLLQEDGVAGVDLGRLDGAGEELVRVAHEVLVQRAVKGDVDREARLLPPACTRTPSLLGLSPA